MAPHSFLEPARRLKFICSLCSIKYHFYSTTNGETIQPRRTFKIPEKEKELPKTVFALFNSEYNLAVNVSTALNSIDLSLTGIQKYLKKKQESNLLNSQLFVPQRLEMLGPDLAASHFVVYRRGKVRFKGHSNWVVKDEDTDDMDLPTLYDENYILEAIDCSGMDLLYEGLENMAFLQNLKWLSLEKCQYIDDWCLDRISGQYRNTLEYLNLSNCPLITERGIASLAKLQNLKTLIFEGNTQFQNAELVCLMLEESLPNLRIKGIKYCDMSLLTNMPDVNIRDK